MGPSAPQLWLGQVVCAILACSSGHYGKYRGSVQSTHPTCKIHAYEELEIDPAGMCGRVSQALNNYVRKLFE